MHTIGTDPRERLQGAAQLAGDESPIAAPEVILFQDGTERVESGRSHRSWAARAQNFVLAYSEVAPGAEFPWHDPLGYIVIGLLDETALRVRHDSGEVELIGRGIVTVPPGASTVRALGTGALARMFPAACARAAALAVNGPSYAEPHPRVRIVEPVAGEVQALRAHRLDEFPNDGTRFGTIFRTETLMVNFLDDAIGPRDPERLSPHHHDDFEQGSFTITGSWTHHIRTPWTKRQSQWRDDDHLEVHGPSLTIIPPPTVHTSRATGPGRNLMIDLFSPAREDFEAQGWVVNADEAARS